MNAELQGTGQYDTELMDGLETAACAGVSWCLPGTGHHKPGSWSAWACNPWALEFPAAFPSGVCSANFLYIRTMSRTRTRGCFRIGWDCSVTATWTETQTQTGNQRGTCGVDLTPWDCALPDPFPAASVPAAPCPVTPLNCTPDANTQSNGPWV